MSTTRANLATTARGNLRPSSTMATRRERRQRQFVSRSARLRPVTRRPLTKATPHKKRQIRFRRPRRRTADVKQASRSRTHRLGGYGSWDNVDGYGQVWTPDATAVGAGTSMPYETSGASGLYCQSGCVVLVNGGTGLGLAAVPTTAAGAGFRQSLGLGAGPCLTGSSRTVEWRGGGGYAGWRPLEPGIEPPRQRRCARTTRTGDFAAENDLGRGSIHARLAGNVADAMRDSLGQHALSVRAQLRGAVRRVERHERPREREPGLGRWR